jgi:hypothetical protein
VVITGGHRKDNIKASDSETFFEKYVFKNCHINCGVDRIIKVILGAVIENVTILK